MAWIVLLGFFCFFISFLFSLSFRLVSNYFIKEVAPRLGFICLRSCGAWVSHDVPGAPHAPYSTNLHGRAQIRAFGVISDVASGGMARTECDTSASPRSSPCFVYVRTGRRLSVTSKEMLWAQALLACRPYEDTITGMEHLDGAYLEARERSAVVHLCDLFICPAPACFGTAGERGHD